VAGAAEARKVRCCCGLAAAGEQVGWREARRWQRACVLPPLWEWLTAAPEGKQQAAAAEEAEAAEAAAAAPAAGGSDKSDGEEEKGEEGEEDLVDMSAEEELLSLRREVAALAVQLEAERREVRRPLLQPCLQLLSET
jgi:hypothetical protein